MNRLTNKCPKSRTILLKGMISITIERIKDKGGETYEQKRKAKLSLQHDPKAKRETARPTDQPDPWDLGEDFLVFPFLLSCFTIVYNRNFCEHIF